MYHACDTLQLYPALRECKDELGCSRCRRLCLCCNPRDVAISKTKARREKPIASRAIEDEWQCYIRKFTLQIALQEKGPRSQAKTPREPPDRSPWRHVPRLAPRHATTPVPRCRPVGCQNILASLQFNLDYRRRHRRDGNGVVGGAHNTAAFVLAVRHLGTVCARGKIRSTTLFASAPSARWPFHSPRRLRVRNFSAASRSRPTAIITSDNLMTALAFVPTTSFSSSTASLVIDDVMMVPLMSSRTWHVVAHPS